MKAFIALIALAAVALAEPEADSYYAGLYNNYGLRSYGAAIASPYTAGYGYSAGLLASPLRSAYSYGAISPYNTGLRSLYKREAEAESDAESYYPYATGYSTLGYNGYNALNTYAYAPRTALSYAAPAAVRSYGTYGLNAYSTGLRSLSGYRLYKREAEADSESDAAYLRTVAGYPYASAAAYGYSGLNTAYAGLGLRSYTAPLTTAAYTTPYASTAAYRPYGLGYGNRFYY